MTILRIALSGLVTIAVAGCSTGPTAATNPTTCADWRSMSETAQTELAISIVDANDLLEAVRAGQHEGPAVPKAALIQDVVGSITKNCDLTGQPVQLVADLVVQLYGAGRASDGYFGASGAPTPQRQSSHRSRTVARAAAVGAQQAAGAQAASFLPKARLGHLRRARCGFDDSTLGRR